jgi:CRP-like cAMP-binding protein
MKITKDIKFLKHLSENRSSDRVHWECCRVMTLEIFNPGDNVVIYGEPGDKYYIIIKGKVGILVPSINRKKGQPALQPLSRIIKRPPSLIIPNIIPEPQPDNPIEKTPKMHSNIDIGNSENTEDDFKEIKILSDGDSFGELALLSNKSRSATVKCKEVSYFAVLSQRDYKRILRTDAEKAIHDRVEYLKKLPMFFGSNVKTLRNLAYMMTECTFRKNQVLYYEGSTAEYISFIKSGEFKLTVKEEVNAPDNYKGTSILKLKMMKKANKKVDLQVVVKGKGEIFGQEELANDQNKRSRTCTCVSTFGQVYMVYINVENI